MSTAGTPAFKLAIPCAAIAAAVWLGLAPPEVLTVEQGRILGIVLITLSLWGTSVVPGYLASLVFFTALLILGLAPPNLVFSGFTSTATWLIVSGFVIGAAISTSGLAARLARGLAPALTGSYARLLTGLMLICMALGFVMPSSLGRAVLLVPIGMALADRAGFAKNSTGRIGIAVVLTAGCNLPSFAILPSNLPNMVLTGAADTILGVHLGYFEYLALHYPVLGLVKSAVVVALALTLFPARTGMALAGTSEDIGPAPTQDQRRQQIRVALVLLATLALWMTDRLHGVNAAWVGMGASILLLLPKLGVVSPPAFKQAVDFGMLLFVAGALALGAVVNSSGLGSVIGTALQSVLPLQPGRDFLNFLSLGGMAILTAMLTTNPGAPAVLTPLAPDLAQASGLGLTTVLMTQVIGFSTMVFAYQVAPLVVAMQLSGEKLSHLARFLVPLAAITIVILLPLDYLWWRLLGWF
ncbi:SLC13 family permease [Alloyangia pacifica]|uniref:SLC13 family permease n=1 Tax=Alloyangia pacifica TaxID=311180 RepID=UPI001CD66DEE|nr:SLC13 family permease [Alloyangia pacifica]MCA0995191.1 anion permease [Alloyangia pacifica]